MVLTGSCPWPEPWFRTYGAHLHLQAREDQHPTAVAVPPASSMTIALEKQALRERARARRAELARSAPDFARRIAEFASGLGAGQGSRVSGYRALPAEADPSLLLDVLEARGCEISYPRVRKGQPLTFHVPVEGERWAQGAFGIFEPRPDWPAVEPAILLVPLLVFDAEGNRLGYGGGYYDRTLAKFRAQRAITAIGVAFAGQEVAHVPHITGDERLDMVVTENGIRRFPKQ
jgi:5-formyltetrahydrofolate cyclo-ligase